MKIKKHVVTFDYHCPWHDAKAVNTMIDITSQLPGRTDTFIIGGDFNDVYLPNRFRKNPAKLFTYLDDELEAGRQLLTEIEKKTKARKFVFLEGNHEIRITNAIFDKIPYLTRYLNPKDMQGVPNHWQYLPYGKKGHYQLGPLVITHGVKYPKHAAANYLSKYKTNIMFGHTHRTNTFEEQTYHGNTIRVFNVGWLGDPIKAADYVEDVDTAIQAFAIIEYWKNMFRIEIINIDKGKAIFNGKVYEGKAK